MKKILFLCISIFVLFGCKDSTSPSGDYNIVKGFGVTDSQGEFLAVIGDYDASNENDKINNGSDNLETKLLGSFPNPFSTVAVIVFSLEEEIHTRIWIENAYPSKELNSLLGNNFSTNAKDRKILTELCSESYLAGSNTIQFNTENLEEELEEGFYRIYFQVEDEIQTHDILLLEEMIPELEAIINEQQEG